ncbi:Aste57867_20343 [Aphanomyces stellatus]|uniref:Aste57867_20343 protein n=1 Tax=Aphanomyces stellatus TaxID=120398 RepID=A0A485LEX0_9STRA|nr:hypothetical protein As57867_020277 [Aphanomyces stellatus]VFT97030.1 Aste57867_20343 [Aphanomyces stellatus]
MSARVVRTVYRELLRNAKLMDKHAAVKALVSPTEVATNPLCQDAVATLLRQKMYYLPYASAVEVVRNAFRTSSQTGDIGAAFLALRFLGDKLNLAKQYGLLQGSPFPPTRTYDLLEKVPSPPSVTITKYVFPSLGICLTQRFSRIRSGVFLIAHPLLFRPFEQSVILITSHTKKEGTTGFIVNEKGDKKHTLFPNYDINAALQPLFGSRAVYYGGPVDGGSVSYLHTEPAIGGIPVDAANESVRLFVGGNLLDFATMDQANAKDVVFFNGYAGWTPNMLQKELAMGSWIMVDAPLSLAIRPPPNLWRHLLNELGPEFDQFSSIPRNVNFYLTP